MHARKKRSDANRVDEYAEEHPLLPMPRGLGKARTYPGSARRRLS